MDAASEAEFEHYRKERLSRVRPVEVREPDERTRRYSGGVELVIRTDDRNSTLIDLNLAEARAWGEALIAFADSH